MRRRDWMVAAGGAWWAGGAARAGTPGAGRPGAAAAALGAQRFALTWREAAAGPVPDGASGPAMPAVPGTGPAAAGRFRAGVLRLDLAAGTMALAAAVDLPGRAHGLVALPDGGCVVVANRPGRWLLRTDAEGRARAWHRLDDERPARTLNGHAEADGDGRWLFTTETDPVTGEGWVSVRDARSLARVLQWRSHGRDPHQALLDADGGLVVANGGIARWPDGRPRAGEPLQASLVRLDARDGRLLGRWTLPDPALSLRHLAWSHPPAGRGGGAPLLGIALQAEHAQPERRHGAPLLAVWDGQRLVLPAVAVDAAWQGYAGDIAPAPAGGFVLSGQRVHQALWWAPGAERLQRVADWTDVCALAVAEPAQDPAPDLRADAGAAGRDAAGLGSGVLVGGARGLALWHPRQPARAWPWPGAWSPDNHLVPLAEPA